MAPAPQASRRMEEAILSPELHAVEISVSSNSEERRKAQIGFLSAQCIYSANTLGVLISLHGVENNSRDKGRHNYRAF